MISSPPSLRLIGMWFVPNTTRAQCHKLLSVAWYCTVFILSFSGIARQAYSHTQSSAQSVLTACLAWYGVRHGTGLVNCLAGV